MTNTIYWQEQPEFGPNHVSVMVDGEFEVFPSFNRLSQYLQLTQGDFDLFEVTPENLQELHSSGVFNV